jgi:hypothetical protein
VRSLELEARVRAFCLAHGDPDCTGEWLVVQAGRALRCPVCGVSYDASWPAIKAADEEAYLSWRLQELTREGMEAREE